MRKILLMMTLLLLVSDLRVWGQGSCSFTKNRFGQDVDFALDIAVGDFDGDGFKDVIVSDYGVCHVFSGHGGAFAFETIVEADGEFVEVGDFNSDGFDDFLVFAQNSEVRFFLNQGDFVFNGIGFGNIEGNTRTGDFNSDGHLDFVIADNSSGTPFLGDGSGSFEQGMSMESLFNEQFVMIDFDNDGKEDFVGVSDSGFGGALVIAKGVGDGTFAEPTTTMFEPEIGSFSSRMASEDLNNDGNLDLVVPDESFTGLLLLFGDGNDAISQWDFISISSQPNDFDLVDFNRDGQVDIVVASSDSLLVFPGFGDGSFGVPDSYLIDELFFAAVQAIGDFDNNGWLDLAVFGSDFQDGGFVFLDDGEGGLSDHVFLDSSRDAFPVASADLNGDEYLDLVVGHKGSDFLEVFYGNGDGAFANAVQLPMNGFDFTEQIVIADFDEDGYPDIAALRNESRVSFYRNMSGVGFAFSEFGFEFGSIPADIAAGDFNQDGSLDLLVANYGGVVLHAGDGTGSFESEDLVSFVSVRNMSAGDLNGDGLVDILLTEVFGDYRLMLADENGGFAEPIMFDSEFSAIEQAEIGDADADGINEIVFEGLQSGGGSGRTVTVSRLLQGNTIEQLDSREIPENSFTLKLANLDFDDELEILVSQDNFSEPGFLGIMQFSKGQIGELVQYDVVSPAGFSDGSIARFAVGDFDGDSIRDVAITIPGQNGVSIVSGRCPGLLGDTNMDGVVNLLDVEPFVNAVVNGEYSFNADINMDGQVDLLDVAPFVQLLIGA